MSPVSPATVRVLPNSFYMRYGKRCFDVACSATGLLLLAPLVLLCAVLVKVSSPGPILFRQQRVGRGGVLFEIFKFRSMYAGAESRGPGITSGNDTRVTKVGRILRRMKLDELPQLWNVLKGDMSMVGPRPELSEYVWFYDVEQVEVLRARPGITDPASIAFRDEETVLAAAAGDPRHQYRHVVMPAKLRMNLEYLRNVSFSVDVRIILETLAVLGRRHERLASVARECQ